MREPQELSILVVGFGSPTCHRLFDIGIAAQKCPFLTSNMHSSICADLNRF